LDIRLCIGDKTRITLSCEIIDAAYCASFAQSLQDERAAPLYDEPVPFFCKGDRGSRLNKHSPSRLRTTISVASLSRSHLCHSPDSEKECSDSNRALHMQGYRSSCTKQAPRR